LNPRCRAVFFKDEVDMNRKQNSLALSVLAQRRNVLATLDRAEIVVIGNGIAGLTAAIEARRYNADKRIVIMTDQLHATINTPALKQFATNKLKRHQLLAYPTGTERSLNINVVGAHVEEIHAESKYLELDNNRTFGYEKLLIATGSKPKGLPEEIPGRDLDGVMVLHRFQDFLDLRRRLPEVREAVVIGSGTHANEVVMTLLHWRVRVHWLLRSKKFLSSTFDDVASDMVLNRVRRAGAIIHTETEVAAIVDRVASVAGVITNTDEMIPCQLVLCCTGTAPAQDLAMHCTAPMRFHNGIVVDGRLRTSLPDIYAAGDVAAVPNPQTGEYETRGQWYASVTQGKIAGAMMAGCSEVAQELFGVHWHATHLGPLSMLTVGDPLGRGANEQVTTYTYTNGTGYRRLAVVEDRLVGYLSVGTAHSDGLSIKRFIDEGLSIRDVVKPLLKGTFDAHTYLKKSRMYPASKLMTRRLPVLEPLQVLLRPEEEARKLQPSIQAPSAAHQIDENALEIQKIGAGIAYQPEPLSLNVETVSRRGIVAGQFLKPGFIDSRYSKRPSLDWEGRSDVGPEQVRVTDSLPVIASGSQLARSPITEQLSFQNENIPSTEEFAALT